MIDFSERRPEIWPNLTARLFRVHSLGFVFRVEPRGEGSRITQDHDRRSKTVLGRCLGAMFQVSGGAPMKRFRQVHGVPS